MLFGLFVNIGESLSNCGVNVGFDSLIDDSQNFIPIHAFLWQGSKLGFNLFGLHHLGHIFGSFLLQLFIDLPLNELDFLSPSEDDFDKVALESDFSSGLDSENGPYNFDDEDDHDNVLDGSVRSFLDYEILKLFDIRLDVLCDLLHYESFIVD